MLSPRMYEAFTVRSTMCRSPRRPSGPWGNGCVPGGFFAQGVGSMMMMMMMMVMVMVMVNVQERCRFNLREWRAEHMPEGLTDAAALFYLQVFSKVRLGLDPCDRRVRGLLPSYYPPRIEPLCVHYGGYPRYC
jgi:hypothetical protein